MVFAALGRKLIIEIRVSLITTPELAPKLSTRACPRVRNLDFHGQNLFKIGTCIDIRVHDIFGPPQGAHREPQGPRDLSKASSGDQIYIFKCPINRKAAVNRTLYKAYYICSAYDILSLNETTRISEPGSCRPTWAQYL